MWTKAVVGAVALLGASAQDQFVEAAAQSDIDPTIEKLICKFASDKQFEEKATGEVCDFITEKFPSMKFDPDCKTVVEAAWDSAVAMCPKMSLGIDPSDIEKIACEIVKHKEIEPMLTGPVCDFITQKFPSLKFDPDCKTAVEELWEIAESKCPKVDDNLAVDPTEAICKLASNKQIEERATDEVCDLIAKKFPTVKIEPDCQTAVEAAWDAAVALCPPTGLEVTAVPETDEGHFKHFISWVRKFGKKYTSKAEWVGRFKAFKTNLVYVVTENAKGHSYELELNEFADMTKHEFGATHFGYRAPDQKMFKGVPYLGRYANATLPPASMDWTTKNAVTPVKNQASCGSCWAFSTTGAIEGAWAVATGKLLSLSEQQLVDCAKDGNMGCKGGSMDLGFKYEEGHGICSEDSYKYLAKDGTCQVDACTVAIPAGGIVGYKDVAEGDETGLLNAVAQQPVAVAIEADQMAFQLYKSGVLSAECGEKLDHGVLVVGYGELDGQKYWKVKNSWGPTWGMDGYVNILRGKAGEGECGIKAAPSYPVVKSTVAPATVDAKAITV
mmetsp:Transcript_43862/g.80126  ORF Transcript_43862/g.80126 Transcript_43862/m.80126 type:complete len:556 (-) Transcript_43862:131-1798(-)